MLRYLLNHLALKGRYISTYLQASAVSVTLDREMTIRSVYITPLFSHISHHLDSLLQQLPSLYLSYII